MRFAPVLPPRRAVRSVLIAHSSPAVAKDIGSILPASGGLELAAVAHKMTQALAVIEITCPDVVLLDLALTRENRLPVLRWIKQKVPACTLVAISQDDVADRLSCLEAGADY